MENAVAAPAVLTTLSDEEVVARIRAGEGALFEILMRRYNQRLFRVALGILGDAGEAEDVMQDAYVRAYTHLDQFAGHARFATWLTRIAVYEALARRRRRRRVVEIDAMPDFQRETLLGTDDKGPEQRVIDRDLVAVLETAIRHLPETYRPVVVLRDVEGLSTQETADCLGLNEAVVKTRLHRGRALLRLEVAELSTAAAPQVFPFHLSRCDRVVAAVLSRLGLD